MMLILSVAILISSETMRTVIENVFADASLIFAENFRPIIVTVLVVAAVAVLMSVMMRGRKVQGKLPPVVHTTIPYLGTFLNFCRSPVGYITELYYAYGDIFTLDFAFEKITFLVGPEAQAVAFRATDEELDQGDPYKFMTPVFGEGIVFDAPLKRRLQQMQIMATGLRNSRMKTYVDKIIGETLAHVETLPEEGTLDLKEFLVELVMNCAARALMGDEIRESLYDEVTSLYHDLDNGCTPVGVFFPYLPIPLHKKRDRAREELTKLFANVIAKRREEGVKKEDILQTFLDATYKDTKEPIPPSHVAGLMIALLFAGQHTSSTTAIWTLLHILDSPGALEKARKEVAEVVGDRPVTYEDLGKLQYLHRCIKETLRMHPPLIFLFRRVRKDLYYKDMVIPAGHLVGVSPAVGGRVAPEFKDSEIFDPDRFGPDREEDKKPFTFIGFGGGMHACVGQQYAYLQLKTVLVSLLQKLDMEKGEDKLPEHDYTSMVVGPQGHPTIRFKRRAVQQVQATAP